MAPIRQILLFSDGCSRKGQFPTSGIYLWTVFTEVHRRIIGKDCKIHFQWLFRVQEDISSVRWFQLVLRKSCHLKCHEVMSDEKMATSHPCSELCWLGNGTCVQNHWGLDLWRATEAVATEFWDSWFCSASSLLLVLALAPISLHSRPALRAKLAEDYSLCVELVFCWLILL